MGTATATRRAGIYARISQDRDGTMLGVERQRADCERFVAARGWELAGLYVDNDVSAYKGKHRPEYERLLEDVRAGKVDAIVAWHPDRLHRSPRELEDFVDVVEAAGAAVETATAGTVDLTTPSGRMVARMLGAAARYESDHKAERVRRKHLEMAQQGRPLRGGSRPFGLTSDWAGVVPAEAELIREAAQRVLAGDSLRGIAADWNARGIVTPDAGRQRRNKRGELVAINGRWQQQPLRRMLTSWRLAGIREHRGERAGTGTWPAILDAPTVERLRAVLRDPRRRTTTIRARRYLLSGLVVCDLCQRRMVARPRQDKVRRYVCASGPMFGGCGKTAILADPLEDHVSAEVVQAIDSPELAALRGRAVSDDGALLSRIREDEEALDQLARDHYVDRIIGRAEFVAARTALDDRLRQSRAALAGRAWDALSATSLGMAAEWRMLDFDRRRAILTAVVEAVTIGAGRRGFNRYDPARVSIAWRA